MVMLSEMRDPEKRKQALAAVSQAFVNEQERWESTSLNSGIRTDEDIRQLFQEARDVEFDYSILLRDAARY